MSVAALFHYMLIAQEEDIDPVACSTLTALRTILDDRDAAEMWGRDDLVRFGPAFRQAQEALTAPYPTPTLQAVTERLLEVHASLEVAPVGGRTLSTLDGRQLTIEPQGFGSVWLLACLLPSALAAAGLTTAIVPCFVSLPRYLAGPISDLPTVIENMLGKTALEGLAELDRLETRVKSIAVDLALTKRSRLPELLRLDIAYPGLRIPAVARLLGVSPQGAAKLVAKLRVAKDSSRSRLVR